jgi:LacI family transcriptional regulator
VNEHQYQPPGHRTQFDIAAISIEFAHTARPRISPVPPKLPVLAFVGPTSYAFDRRIAMGILDYLHSTGSGRLLNAEGDWSNLTWEGVLNLPTPPQGIIHHSRPGRAADWLAARGISHVNVGRNVEERETASVISDDEAVGRSAAEYFLGRGYRNFAYTGFPGHGYSTARGSGFLRRVEEAGLQAAAIGLNEPDSAAAWKGMLKETPGFLKSLPLPCALFCCNDARARMMAVEALRAGLRIPEDLAILGVDNDDFTCVLSPVPLSSVEPDCETIGRTAARVVLELIAGRGPDRGESVPVIRIPPVRVVERRSTDALAVSDDQVARALRFIHAHALEPIDVEMIAREAGLARRKLERAFRAHTGASPYAEILRLRIEHAKALLTTTGRKVSEIAEECGFATGPEFSVAFRKRVGRSPLQYRREPRHRT